MISGVPAPISRAIPPYYSHARHNGVTPEHAGALAFAQRLLELILSSPLDLPGLW